MTIKTFRGLLADRAIDRIYLAGDEPGDGYRIKKFQLFPAGATSAFNYESFVSIFKIPQSTPPADATPDFSNQTLIACGYYTQSASATTNAEDMNIVFDNEIFNQDIYITHSNSDGASAINYYIELEQVMMPKGEQAVVNFNAALLHGD